MKRKNIIGELTQIQVKDWWKLEEEEEEEEEEE